MKKNKTALVIADIKNVNLGDKVIFSALSTFLKSEGFNCIYKVSNITKKDGQIFYIDYKNILRLIKSIYSSDSVFLGGGGIFQDETSQANLIYFFLLVFLAFLFNKEINIKGVGITPLNSKLSRCLIRLICKMTNNIELRDYDSKNILIKYTDKPITVTKDLALAYEPDFSNIPEYIKVLTKSKYLLVSLRPLNQNPKKKTYFSEDIKESFESILTSSLRNLADELKLKLVFVPFHREMDYEYISGLWHDRLKLGDVILKELTPDIFCYLAKNSISVISMRLHGVILASKYPVSLWAIEYDDKVAHFMASIRKLNFLLKITEVKGFSCRFKKELRVIDPL